MGLGLWITFTSYLLKTSHKIKFFGSFGRFSVDTIPLNRQKTLIGPEGKPKPPKLSMKINPKCWRKSLPSPCFDIHFSTKSYKHVVLRTGSTESISFVIFFLFIFNIEAGFLFTSENMGSQCQLDTPTSPWLWPWSSWLTVCILNFVCDFFLFPLKL